jgi:preprotein translocase subunit SecG
MTLSSILLIILVTISVLLIGLVLLQQSKSGGSGGAFGGGQNMTGSSGENKSLVKFTYFLAFAFGAASVALAVLSKSANEPQVEEFTVESDLNPDSELPTLNATSVTEDSGSDLPQLSAPAVEEAPAEPSVDAPASDEMPVE